VVLGVIGTALVSACIGGYFISTARENRTNWKEAAKHLEIVRGTSFNFDQIVELDGKAFINCHFDGAIFVWKGTKPFALEYGDLNPHGRPIQLRVPDGDVYAHTQLLGAFMNEMIRGGICKCDASPLIEIEPINP
jgi:hypothetical protein